MSVFTTALRQSFIRMPVPAKLVFLLLMVLFLMITGFILAVLIAVPLFHNDVSSLYNLIENPDPENIGVVKFFQIIQSVFLFLLPAWLAAWLFSDNTVSFLKADKYPSGYTLIMVSATLFIAIPLMNAVTWLNSQLDLPVWMTGLEERIRVMEENAGKLTGLFLESNSASDLIVNLLMIAVLPALGEEFLFRGILQRMFIDWTKSNHTGVILAAFLFSFIHFQFYGFIPRFLLGLFFGYLLIWSSSIWVPVAGHFINNAIAVFFYHFSAGSPEDSVLDRIGTNSEGHYLLYLSIVFTAVITGMIYLHERQAKTAES